MKSNKLLILIFIYSFVVLTGCNIHPTDYEKDVEDNVKLYVAEAYFIYDRIVINNNISQIFGEAYDALSLLGLRGIDIDMDNFDDFNDRLTELWMSEENMTYKEALENATEWTETDYDSHYATQILEYYNGTSIVLSDYQLIKDTETKRIWKFKELNSDILFTFTFDIESNTYMIEPIEDSFYNFIKKRVNL